MFCVTGYRLDSPGNHPACYMRGTGSYPGIKWAGQGVNHPSPSSSKVKERVEYTFAPSQFPHGRL